MTSIEEHEVVKRYIDAAISKVISETGVHFRIIYNTSSKLTTGFGCSFVRHSAHIYHKNELIQTLESTAINEQNAKFETIQKVLKWMIHNAMNGNVRWT